MTVSERPIEPDPGGDILGIDRRYVPLAVFAWIWVAVPFGYGLYQLLTKVAQLFSG